MCLERRKKNGQMMGRTKKKHGHNCLMILYIYIYAVNIIFMWIYEGSIIYLKYIYWWHISSYSGERIHMAGRQVQLFKFVADGGFGLLLLVWCCSSTRRGRRVSAGLKYDGDDDGFSAHQNKKRWQMEKWKKKEKKREEVNNNKTRKEEE